jgi:SAM-dependent methyltransferase
MSNSTMESTVASLTSEVNRLIDHQAIARLTARYGNLSPDPGPSKFLDVQRFLPINVERAVRLNLHKASSLHILDIGCGPGYFMLVARYLGHKVVGLDLNEHPIFLALTKLFALPVRTGEVRSSNPLPIDESGFDLITAFLVCFNHPSAQQPWDSTQWEFFRRDCDRRLNHGGWLFLELNRQLDQRYYSDELWWYFSRMGNVHGKEIAIPKSFPLPAGAPKARVHFSPEWGTPTR